MKNRDRFRQMTDAEKEAEIKYICRLKTPREAPSTPPQPGEQREIWEEVARNHTGGINESGLKHLLEHFVITRKQ